MNEVPLLLIVSIKLYTHVRNVRQRQRHKCLYNGIDSIYLINF